MFSLELAQLIARMNKAPSFFTLYEAGEDDFDLRIPIAFNQCIDEPLPEEVLLRDRNHNLWTVKVGKKGKFWYFVDGWNKFVKDNSLTSKDLLVFSYVSNDLFNVKLYGINATEKNISGPSSIETYGQISEDNEDSDDNAAFSENNANNDGNGGIHRQRIGALWLYGKCYGMEIFEAGLAEKPAGPYFVAKLNPRRISDLFIPADVIKDYSLTLDEDITLVDPEGREFSSNCRKWGDGRYVVSRGWVSLCRVNAVNEETKCICEFVQREGDQRQFLHIHFVR